MSDIQTKIRTAINRVPLCGCGSSDKMWEIVKAVLERAERPREGKPSFYDPMPEHDLSGVAVEYVAQSLSHADLLEHGVSVGYSWPTAAGDLLLRFLRKYGTAQGNIGSPSAWPEWAEGCDADEQFECSPEEWHQLSTGATPRDPIP